MCRARQARLHRRHALLRVADSAQLPPDQNDASAFEDYSNRGRDDRSLEVGALIRDDHFVQSVLAAWADVEHLLEPIPKDG